MADQASQRGVDERGRKSIAAWPVDVIVTAASMVVDQGLAAKRVAEEQRIPCTTLMEWVQKYRLGGRVVLESASGRGGK